MANEVRLTFAGDATQLTQTMAGVGSASEDMTKKVEDASDGLKGTNEVSDHFATHLGTLAGAVGGVTGGLALMGVGTDSLAGKILGGISVGIGALSAGMDLLAVATNAQTLAYAKNAAAWVAGKATMIASTVATGAATAAQWALNVAMSANPIALVVIAIVALIAIFVVLWNKCDWFRNLWVGLWNGIKSTASNVWEWLKGLPESLKTAFTTLGDIIFGPFKWAFNKVADAWNATVGKLSWTVPSWVPFIGGNTISAPKLPHFHTGISRVPGPPGQDVIAVVQAGERVFTSAQADAMDRGAVTGDTFIFHLEVDPTKFKTIEDFMAWVDNLRNSQRRGLAVA